jgi:hypothetical protein
MKEKLTEDLRPIFEKIEHKVCVNFKIPATDKRTWIPIWFYGDLHVGHEDFDCEQFFEDQRFASSVNAYQAIVGDTIEASIPTHMPATMWNQEATPAQQRKWIEKHIFKPAQDKIAGVIQGNHEARISKMTSEDPLEIICDKYCLNYMDCGGYLVFDTGSIKYNILLLHGDSGSKNPRLEIDRALSAYSNVDVVAIGHNHQNFFEERIKNTLDPNNNNKFGKDRVATMRTGGYITYPKYIHKKISTPTAIGSQLLWINRTHKEFKSGWVNLNS